MLSKKARLLKPSPTLALAQKARELFNSGKDVVSLTVGEPDWDTFPKAKMAGIAAIEEGFTKYTPVSGIPELKVAIAKQTSQLLGVDYKPSEICVGTGAKFILFSALQMLLDPGDEVLIPSPYWVSYPVMVDLAGGTNKIIECGQSENFKLTPSLLEKSITAKTKILILCSPSNPTGLIYSADELKALSVVLLKNKNIFIISDDIYHRLIFKDEVAPHFLQVCPELKDRLLLVNGASKSYSMTGWRIGWGLGPSPLIQAMSDYISQSTSSASSIGQKAALAAIESCDVDLEKTRQELKIKKDWFYQRINEIKGFQAVEPQGAFYFWVRVADFFGNENLKNSKDVADMLLEKYFVATVPGIEFGCEGYLRLSFATSQKNLEKALERFQGFSRKFLGL